MCILSVDLGTTSIKTAIIEENGNILGKSIKEYTLLTPSALEVELSVDTYWEAFKIALKELLVKTKVNVKNVKALGISVQGETLILVDEKGIPINNAIIWLDNRAQEEAKILSSEFSDQLAYKITGQVKIVPTWPATKILWLKRNKNEIFEKAYKFLLLEDYFIFKLTGKYVAESSLLSSTLYWNIKTKKWWGEMLDYLEVSEEKLPEIRESGEIVDYILPEVAKELGVDKNMIITTGALDQAAGAIGVGNVKPGIFSENTGAALAICATVNSPFLDPQNKMPCHYHGIPDLYMAHTFTSGGMVLKWFRDKFCQAEIELSNLLEKDSYKLLDEEVKNIPPGCNGLVMLPHLEGAMAPEANSKAKGVFFGFTLHHSKPHFIRSTMEAITCIVRRNIDVLENLGMKFEEVICSGGGAKSPIWNQMKADILNKKTITTTNDQDAACLGAAIIAGKAIGLYKNVKDASEKVIKIKNEYLPNPENRKVYDNLYRKYTKLYESLVELFEVS